MARGSPLTQAVLRELTKFPRLDPRAVIADAMGEGLGGGIGDQGTSFGPFQLHYGGAYPSSAPQGAQASQQWAWSPAGIDYGLGQINQVAGGLTGPSAVDAIVRRFERPKNPDEQVRIRTGYLGAAPVGGSAYQTGVPAPAASSSAARPQAPPQSPLAQPHVQPSRQLPAAVLAALQVLRA